MIYALVFLLLAHSQYSGPLKAWFDQLASNRGPCCSFADGRMVEDPDWGADLQGYWVIVDGQRIHVPSSAIITTQNIFGPAVVWPYRDANGIQIRCFLPGAQV